jgi:hypothetical protein
MSNCTITGNLGPEVCIDSSVSDYLIKNSIIWGNEGEAISRDYGWVSMVYSCIEGNWPCYVEECFDADPSFVKGPSGYYYLSDSLAGQPESSLCVDSGIGAPADYELDGHTTRSDGVFDFGRVDMGYHYPGISPPPSIECKLSFCFVPLLPIKGYLSLENMGPETFADVYVIFICPDGGFISFTESGFVTGLEPWLSNVHLPTGYIFDMQEMFAIELSGDEDPGAYYLIAALTMPDEFTFAAEPSVLTFEMD